MLDSPINQKFLELHLERLDDLEKIYHREALMEKQRKGT